MSDDRGFRRLMKFCLSWLALIKISPHSFDDWLLNAVTISRG